MYGLPTRTNGYHTHRHIYSPLFISYWKLEYACWSSKSKVYIRSQAVCTHYTWYAHHDGFNCESNYLNFTFQNAFLQLQLHILYTYVMCLYIQCMCLYGFKICVHALVNVKYIWNVIVWDYTNLSLLSESTDLFCFNCCLVPWCSVRACCVWWGGHSQLEMFQCII